MRELTKIDGHEPVESSMCELRDDSLMRRHALMDKRQFAGRLHFTYRLHWFAYFPVTATAVL